MITLYLRKSILIGTLLAFSGCGGEISRIEGLPQTMDTSGVPWPQLVDVPDAPTEGLEIAKGRTLLAQLNAESTQVLERRAAAPVPLEAAILQSRAAESQARQTVPTAQIDAVALTQRGQRLSRLRGVEPVAPVDTAALRQRAARVRDAQRFAQDVNTPDLLQRAERVRNAGLYGQKVDTLGLQDRARRAQASGNVPRPKPATIARPAADNRKALDAPVLGQGFLARAKAARERAQKEAAVRE